MADSKAQDLLDLLQQDRAHPDRSTSQQQIFYRSQAESALGSDENLYRFQWTPKTRQLAVQLLGRDSVATEDSAVAERDWAAYLESFVLSDTTIGVDASKLKPYLARYVPPCVLFRPHMY
jgi:paired amphipathic helix protein Sin3a